MNNTGGNRSFSVAKSIKIETHPPCGTENIGVQRSGKSTDEPDDEKETHMSCPQPIISFNSAEDIEGKRGGERSC